MKPLELTIYPRRGEQPNPLHDGWDTWRAWDTQRTRELHARRDKRFTDAELAAEWWQAMPSINALILNPRRAGKAHAANVANTLHRFATAPHYYEEQE